MHGCACKKRGKKKTTRRTRRRTVKRRRRGGALFGSNPKTWSPMRGGVVRVSIKPDMIIPMHRLGI